MRRLTLVFTLLIFFACENESMQFESGDIDFKAVDSFEDVMEMPVPNQSPTPDKVDTEQPTQKLIKQGGITFESQDIGKDYQKIIHLLPKYGAYIEDENQNKSYNKISYKLRLRVPSGRYDTLYNALVGVINEIDSKHSNVKDVTERYYDLVTRIKNKKILEARYLKLLNKAVKIKDILEIEEKLNTVRVEIESMEGKLRYLSKQVAFSTISLNFYQIIPQIETEKNQESFFTSLISSFQSGWGILLKLILGMVNLWPFLLMISAIVYIIKRWSKSRNRK